MKKNNTKNFIVYKKTYMKGSPPREGVLLMYYLGKNKESW
jgi:hypothetical protein